MTTEATPADQSPTHERNWQELVLTVLLLVASLGTSWSSYQATRWNGGQAAAAGRTSAIRISAVRAQGLSQAESQVDVATFIAWTDAESSMRPRRRAPSRCGSPSSAPAAAC